MKYIFKVTPMGAPRMSRQDRFMGREVVTRYKAFGILLRNQALRQKFTLPDKISFTFTLPMPASWSGKKRERMIGTPHQQKPDIDNLIKAFMDGITYRDKLSDATVWYVNATKLWGEEGLIEVEDER